MWSPQASGMSIIIECSRDRPVASNNSSALSRLAVSLCPDPMIGSSFSTSSPSVADAKTFSRAVIQLMFPRSVLISPLWITMRYGWANRHDPSVLVENRECTRAKAVTMRSSARSW